MVKRLLLLAGLAIVAGSAFVLLRERSGELPPKTMGFVQTRRSRFLVDGHAFRFVGANVAVMYRDDDRARMPETLSRAAQAGMSVVRVWASAEGGPNDVGPVADFA